MYFVIGRFYLNIMKVTASRSTEIFIECPKCKTDITHIPDKMIQLISEKYKEKLKCPKCGQSIEVVKVEG